jgi:hypothetical protein
VKYSGVVGVDMLAFPLWQRDKRYTLLFESQVEAGNSTAERISAAKSMVDMVKSVKVDLVVIEDYTRQRMSFNSYTTGELSGMLRMLLFFEGIRQLWCSPVWLKKFLCADPECSYPKTKQQVAVLTEHYFGFKSRLAHAKERTDATDAFVLAMIGGIYLLHEAEDIETEKEVRGNQVLNGLYYGHGDIDGLMSPKHVLAGRADMQNKR